MSTSAPTKHPLITFALFAYNQEDYIAEAVLGALSQTYSPLEIILSDDCSSDRTYEIMEELATSYTGPHTVVLNRNDKNLNIGGHVNRIMELAHGEWIVAAAGDDISLPERTSTLMNNVLSQTSQAEAAFSAITYFSEDEEKIERYSFIEQNVAIESIISRDVKVTGCSFAWSKEVFEVFGPLHNNIVVEDHTIAFRAALLGNVLYVPALLVKVRIVNGSAGRPDSPEKLLRYFTHWLNVYSHMFIDLNRYIQLRPQEVQQALHLSECIRRHYQYFLIRIGRRFCPNNLSFRDYLYMLQDTEMWKHSVSYIIRRLKELVLLRISSHAGVQQQEP